MAGPAETWTCAGPADWPRGTELNFSIDCTKGADKPRLDWSLGLRISL
ncbi:MAG: hypothetical protein U1F43_35280 [Myxococcota bacterium]